MDYRDVPRHGRRLRQELYPARNSLQLELPPMPYRLHSGQPICPNTLEGADSVGNLDAAMALCPWCTATTNHKAKQKAAKVQGEAGPESRSEFSACAILSRARLGPRQAGAGLAS